MNLLLLLFLNFLSGAQESLCERPSPAEFNHPLPPLNVVKTPEEAQLQFDSVYQSSQRIRNRIFWSQQNQSYVFEKNQNTFIIPTPFIQNLAIQLTQALELGYAKHLYYADLGHLHLLVPKENLDPIIPKESFFNSPQLLSLFHTGELYQFKKGGSLSGAMTENADWQWIYRHRNFVGLNQAHQPITPLFSRLDAFYNTVRTIEGYKEIGSVYFSANKNGCFRLQKPNSSLRFDISVSL